MSNLAKVICLLLVAMATSVSAQLTLAEGRKAVDRTVSFIGSHLESEYKRQARQLQEFISRDSAKLIELKEMKHTALGKQPLCYEEHQRSCEEVHEKLGNIRERLLQDLENHKERGLKKLTQRGDHTAVAACVKKCVKEVWTKSLATFDEAVAYFEHSVKEMEDGIKKCDDSADPWISTKLETFEPQQEE